MTIVWLTVSNICLSVSIATFSNLGSNVETSQTTFMEPKFLTEHRSLLFMKRMHVSMVNLTDSTVIGKGICCKKLALDAFVIDSNN